MAQGDLYRLLRRVGNALERDMDSKGKGSERFRERINRYPHDVHISRDAIRDEILIQLNDFKLSAQMTQETGKVVTQGARRMFGSGSGRTREESAQAISGLATTEGFSAAQLKVIEEQADAFVREALNAVGSRSLKGVSVTKIAGDNKNFVLRFVPKRASSNVYEAINKTIFQPAKDRIARQLNAKGFPISESQKLRIFNIGHINAVSTLKGTRALAAVNRGTDRILGKYGDPIGREVVDKLRLDMMSKFTKLGNPEFEKEILMHIATVKPEAEATNITDSDYEAAILRDVKNTIQKTMESLPNDWAKQKSSDAIMDLLAKEAAERWIKTFTSRGLKVTGPRLGRKDTTPAKTNDIEIQLKKPKIEPKNVTLGTFGGLELPQAKVGRQTAGSKVNLRSLIPMLNQRLPEIVRANMGKFGRLVNRTGRFAESAEIVNIDDDPVTISYTYQLNPYNVFERQGSRDPKDLIDISIRELARGLIIDKFATRRI